VNALWGLLRKETYHILRDRRTLAVLIFMPVVQVILFGYSIRTDVKNVRLAIVDPSPDATTLEIRARLVATDMFRVIAVVSNAADVDPLFETDTAQVAVEFQPGFGQRLASGDVAQIMIVSDATEPNTGSARQAYVSAVLQRYDSERQQRRGTVHIVPEVRARFNPTRESANLFVPGLMIGYHSALIRSTILQAHRRKLMWALAAACVTMIVLVSVQTSTFQFYNHEAWDLFLWERHPLRFGRVLYFFVSISAFYLLAQAVITVSHRARFPRFPLHVLETLGRNSLYAFLVHLFFAFGFGLLQIPPERWLLLEAVPIGSVLAVYFMARYQVARRFIPN